MPRSVLVGWLCIQVFSQSTYLNKFNIYFMTKQIEAISHAAKIIKAF